VRVTIAVVAALVVAVAVIISKRKPIAVSGDTPDRPKPAKKRPAAPVKR
jgi:hypothetical protein